nr:type II toxin-antitoxin system YafQ family toxin [Rhizobium sp. NFR07]
MPSNKRSRPASTKRASLPRVSSHSKQFLKDRERMSRSGRYDMGALKTLMLLLMANDAPLPPEYKDHELNGEWDDHRECHVGGDFLLIYSVEEKKNLIVFVATGTHAELFE